MNFTGGGEDPGLLMIFLRGTGLERGRSGVEAELPTEQFDLRKKTNFIFSVK